MNRCTRFTLAAAASLILVGCRTDTVAPPPSGPSFAVSDGAHSGNPDFFFLPPMFKNPNTNPNYEPAAFNPNLRPAVEICLLGPPALDGTRDCVGAPITRFEPSQISVSLTDQQYQVNWRTDLSNLNLANFYRIQVLVGTRVLGFADVDPVANLGGKGLQNLQTGDFIPLVDGRTLPIKFRIESGALCSVDGTPCNSGTINLNTGGTIELLGAGEDFKLDVRAGTAATFGGQPVTDVTFNLELCSGIDVDLPTFGPCFRVGTYFNGTGSGALEFSKPLLLSMCVLNSVYHTPDETRQEGLITLHQQDGTLIQALPHAEPNCGSSGTIGSSGWGWLRELAARFLTPTAAYAATRSALLHVGAGGETSATGSSCTPSSPTYADVPGVMLSTTCPPSSPTVERSGPQPSAMALINPPRTVSDFQFALPAKMDYLNRADADRTAAPGTALPTAVKVTDWDGTAVQGAHVTFIEPAIEGPPTVIGTATSNSDGVAQISWTIRAGANTAVATGRGIAAQNNYPNNGTVKPFMPDISQPTNLQSPVALGIGRVTFTATGGAADFTVHDPLVSPAQPTEGQALTISAIVTNAGVVSAAPATVNLCVVHFFDGGGSGASCAQPLTPTLAPGQSATMTETLNGQVPGIYHVYASVDTFNVVAESNEANNSVLGPAFTVLGNVIGFEALPTGAPACGNCDVTDQFAAQGVEFNYESFDHVFTGGTLGDGHNLLYGDAANLDNHFVTSAITESGAGISGVLTMTLRPPYPRTVRFHWSTAPDVTVPMNVFPNGSGTPLPDDQISRTPLRNYTNVAGAPASWYTVEVSSAAGIQRIVFIMTNYIQQIDDVERIP